MKLREALGRLAHEERGGILVTFAVCLPIFLGFTGMVIDVGNWFEHKRHLQLQADAGALAGAQEFRFPCDDTPIVSEAANYAGDQYNPQVGSTAPEDVHRLINSRTYYNQTSPVDETVREGGPCDAKMVDVKLTETDLPWFLKLAQVPHINAHARVEIRALERSDRALPIAVPDVRPKLARAIFVNEATGTVLATTDLKPAGVSNGLSLWSNADTPLPVGINAADVGVRIMLSGSDQTTCGVPLVECYDAQSVNQGLVHIRGWDASGSGAQPGAPLARSVRLFSGSCDDPYFSAQTATCTVGVRATVDFGVADPTTVGAKVTATANGTDYPLTYNASTGQWESSGAAQFIPLAAGAGPVNIGLKWEETKGTQAGSACTDKGGNKCKGSFGVVQRTFSATDTRSGPVKLLNVSENGVSLANSFQRCSTASCTHNLVVTMGIKSSLENAKSVNDPIVSLRVIRSPSGNASQNQSLDCDPALSTLADEIALGCGPAYERNKGTAACPGTATALWATPQPWECVASEPGQKTNEVGKGFNRRILGDEKATSCTAPNNWSKFPDLPRGDPRVVQVFLTPFGTFSGSGSATFPVQDFATFYVTGWTTQGGGFVNPCQGNGDDPVPGDDPAVIVGHFIKYIDTLNEGGGGDELCDFTSFGSCIAVMTE